MTKTSFVTNKTKLFAVAAIAVAALTLSGCIKSKTTVTVNPDGSGTIEETMLMNKDIVAMMAGFDMMGNSGDSKEDSGSDGEDSSQFSIYDPDELQQNAEKMGAGVKLVSSEALEDDWGSGFRAVYSFTDINKLQLNQNPAGSLPINGEAAGMDMESAPEYMKFNFKKGSPSVLEVSMPPDKSSDTSGSSSDGAGDNGSSQEDLSMMMQFYRDMRVQLDVVFKGTIVDSTATYRNGNTVTLMDFQFNDLLADPAFMKSIQSGESGGMDNLQALGQRFPNLKIESKPTVRVRFR